MFRFYTPWKRQKTFGFLTFSGVQKRNIGLKYVELLISFTLSHLKHCDLSLKFNLKNLLFQLLSLYVAVHSKVLFLHSQFFISCHQQATTWSHWTIKAISILGSKLTLKLEKTTSVDSVLVFLLLTLNRFSGVFIIDCECMRGINLIFISVNLTNLPPKFHNLCRKINLCYVIPVTIFLPLILRSYTKKLDCIVFH